jgi:hypothetical protein
VTDYPSSKHRQAADRIKKDVDKVLH